MLNLKRFMQSCKNTIGTASATSIPVAMTVGYIIESLARSIMTT